MSQDIWDNHQGQVTRNLVVEHTCHEGPGSYVLTVTGADVSTQ